MIQTTELRYLKTNSLKFMYLYFNLDKRES